MGQLNFLVINLNFHRIDLKNFFKIKRVNLDYIAISAAIWSINQPPIEALKKIKNVIDNY